MTDRISAEQRKLNMQHIRSKNTSPELYLRKLLFSEGFRYRLYPGTIPGHPDIWLAKYNTAVFVNGCFWHRHAGCRYAYMPKSRVDFWSAKFAGNISRDRKIREDLEEKKIRVLTVWECTIRSMKKEKERETEVLCSIREFLNSSETEAEL